MAENVSVSKFANTRKNFTKFYREIIGELKKVIWPNKVQLINHTMTVLLSCLVVGAIIWSVDYGLAWLVKFIINR